MLGGYMGKVLDVNLSNGEIKAYALPERLLSLYVGNKGLGSRLLYELTPPGVDPLGSDNVIIITTAPLTVLAHPAATGLMLPQVSAHRGIVNSNCGGDFGVHLKKAGYDALIIRGKAPRPSRLVIEGNRVEIIEAADLWGLDTHQTQEKLPAKTGKIVIGPAGENLVKYAAIVSGDRVAGRAGVGTVMGSKNLKAVSATGNLKPQPAQKELFKETCRKWRELSRSHPATGEQLPRFGTAAFVNICNATHTLPTRNFQSGQFEQAEAVSGETLTEKHLVRNVGCLGCPIACGRQVMLDGMKIKGPEYETVGLLGPNLAIGELEPIIEWNYLADLYGIDTISLGGVLGFVMEAGEKGLLKTDLAFGKTASITKAIEDIAYRRGFGDEMAENALPGPKIRRHGIRHAEQGAGADPRTAGRVGHGLGYAVASRGGCHIAAGYCVTWKPTAVTVDR